MPGLGKGEKARHFSFGRNLPCKNNLFASGCTPHGGRQAGVLEEQLNSLYREAERRGYTVVNGGAEHRCAGDLDRPALFAMLAAVRGGRVDAVMLTRLSRFSYHRLALYLILCFLQDHGVGLITTEYELRYILYLRGFERTLLDRAQENGCNALWAEGE